MVENYSEKVSAQKWLLTSGVSEGILPYGTAMVFKKTPMMAEKLQAMNLKAKLLDDYFISKMHHHWNGLIWLKSEKFR